MATPQSLMEYLRGAGREYPSLSSLAEILMALQAKQSMGGPSKLKKNIRGAARSARETIGSNVRGEASNEDYYSPEPVAIAGDKPPKGADPDLWAKMRVDAAETQAAKRDRGEYAPTVVPGIHPALRGNMSEDYVPYREGVNAAELPYPDEGGFQQDEILAKFKEMNPNLDWDKVASQVRAKGGNPNVPGGTLSVMPDTRPYAQSDEAYIQWVKDSTYQQELERRRDPRSRAYDPEIAQQMVNEKALEQGNAAEMLKSIALQQQAQANIDEVDVVRKKMSLQANPAERVNTLITALMESTDKTTDKDILGIYRDALVLNMLGRTDEAVQLLTRVGAMTQAGVNQANQTGAPQVLD